MLAKEEFKKDREIVKTAVYQNGWAIRFADTELRKDKEIVKISLDNDCKSRLIFRENRSFLFADMTIKSDQEFILELLPKHSILVLFADMTIKSDQEFILELLPKHSILGFSNVELVNNREFALRAVKANPLSFKYIPDIYKNDREILTAALDHPPMRNLYYGDFFSNHSPDNLSSNEILQMVNPEFGQDREIALKSVKLSGCNLQHVHSKLREDPDVVLAALSHSAVSFVFAGESLSNNDEFLYRALENFTFSSRYLMLNRDKILKAVSINGKILKYCKGWLQDKEIVMKAIQQDYQSIEFADPQLWEDPEIIQSCINSFFQ